MEAVDVAGAWVHPIPPKVVPVGSEDDDDDDSKSDDDDADDSDEGDYEDGVKSAQPPGTMSKRYRSEEENLKIQSVKKNADGESRFDEVSANHISYLVLQKKDVYAIPRFVETGEIAFGSNAQRRRQKEGTIKLGQQQAEKGVTGKGNLCLTQLFDDNSIMHYLLGSPNYALLRNEIGSSKLFNSTEAAGSRVGEYSVPFVLIPSDDGSKKVATFSDHRVHDHAPSTLSVCFNAIVLHL